MRQNNPVLFYGWIIALVSAFSLALGGASRFSLGLFYLSILDEFGWSRAATAVAATAGALIYGFTAPAIGAVTDAFGPRIILPLWAVALGACSVHDGIELERWVPTVTIITAAFISSARTMAQAKGLPNYPYVVIPHPIANVDQTQLRERAQAVAPEITRVISGA